MIRTHQTNGTLHVTLCGRQNLSMVYDLAQAFSQTLDSCTDYCLDLHHAADITDGGLSVLTMFVRRARRMGRTVRLLRCNRALARRIAALPALYELLVPAHVAAPQCRPRSTAERNRKHGEARAAFTVRAALGNRQNGATLR